MLASVADPAVSSALNELAKTACVEFINPQVSGYGGVCGLPLGAPPDTGFHTIYKKAVTAASLVLSYFYYQISRIPNAIN